MTSLADSSRLVLDASGRGHRRALVVRIGALGDVLLTRRLASSLSRGGFQSTLLAPARHAAILLADPWIDEVLDSESPRFAEAFAGSWPGPREQFDLALVISNSPGLTGAMNHAATKVIRIPPEPQANDLSIALQWARHANTVCEPITGTLPSLKANVERGSALPGSVLIHPGSGSPSKNWPMDRFLELGRRLGASGHDVRWIRGPAESAFPAELSDQVIDRPALDVLAATLAGSALFIGNDSGVSHLAAAVGAPTLALFGPTLSAVWRPDGPRVVVVSSGSGALEDLSLDRVLEAANDLTRLGPSV